MISGGQQVATGGVFSDYLQLSCIHPLQPGDENYANCVAIPICAPGLKLFPRRPFAPRADNSFDYPLSSRFDESDSYVVFDNVFVPWEHVFIYRNIELTRDQWFKTPSHIYGNHQAQVRYVTKLRFMMGLAQRMTEMIGTDDQPPVQIAMGELASLASIYEGMLLAHEINAPIINGVLWPSRVTLYSAMAMQSEFNGRMLEMIRELVSSSVISLPSSVADFDNPEIAPYHRALHALRHHGRAVAHRAGAAAVGLHRHRVRQPPPAIREVLWRLVVRGEAERLPQLRLQARDRAGRPARWRCRRSTDERT